MIFFDDPLDLSSEPFRVSLLMLDIRVDQRQISSKSSLNGYPDQAVE